MKLDNFFGFLLYNSILESHYRSLQRQRNIEEISINRIIDLPVKKLSTFDVPSLKFLESKSSKSNFINSLLYLSVAAVNSSDVISSVYKRNRIFNGFRRNLY